MKYTIEGLSQERLVALGLDAVDAVILRWFIDFWPMMEKISVGGVHYGWVAYAHLIEDLPVLRIENKEVISRRFKRYRDAKIMLMSVKDNNRTFFAITEKWQSLVRGPSTLKSNPLDSRVEPPSTLKSNNPSSSHQSFSPFSPREEGDEEKVSSLAREVPWKKKRRQVS